MMQPSKITLPMRELSPAERQALNDELDRFEYYSQLGGHIHDVGCQIHKKSAVAIALDALPKYGFEVGLEAIDDHQIDTQLERCRWIVAQILQYPRLTDDECARMLVPPSNVIHMSNRIKCITEMIIKNPLDIEMQVHAFLVEVDNECDILEIPELVPLRRIFLSLQEKVNRFGGGIQDFPISVISMERLRVALSPTSIRQLREVLPNVTKGGAAHTLILRLLNPFDAYVIQDDHKLIEGTRFTTVLDPEHCNETLFFDPKLGRYYKIAYVKS